MYSEWTPWSPCSAACQEPGFSSRSRVILDAPHKPKHHGRHGGYDSYSFSHPACDTSSLEEWRDCFGEQCSADCQPADWEEWGPCSAPCGPGERQRSRGVFADAVGFGAPCDVFDQVEACNNGPCAQDCIPGNWQSWSQCSSPCGPGQRSRARDIIQDAVFGGRPCGPCDEVEACDSGPCVQDCIPGNWQPWSQCSSPCGPGQRSRARSILQQPSFGGQQCGPCDEVETCDNGPCAQDCSYGQWQPWSECPSCGQGQRTRQRQIITEGCSS